MFETLENRRLLSFAVADGVLTVTGTANADRIAISRDGTNLTIREGAASATTPAAGVTKIVINGLGGNDELRLVLGPDHGVNLPATLNGGEGHDRLFGGGGNDQLNGNAGNDILNGGPGNDILNGNDGNDGLLGGPGADVFNGGGGIDTADYREARSNLIITLDNVNNDGAPALAATATAPARPAENDNVKGDVENVIGGRGNDRITGSPANNRLVGGPGNDILNGENGNDVLEGGPGADQLNGGAGNDFLLGKDETRDSLNGGDGDDKSTNDASDVLSSIEQPNQPAPQPPPPPPQP